jgi:GDP-L-fucose synthase
MGVESLLTGPLEPTNEAYAVAKIAGLKMCQAYRQEYGANFITAIPGNAFGPGDDFDLEDGHVIPALIRRMHEAKERGEPSVSVWGTGTPRREFIFSDDVADASIFIMNEYDQSEVINLGGGVDLSIGEVAAVIKDVVGFDGEIQLDSGRPDGMPLKILDSRPLLNMGWSPRIEVREAIAQTYSWFLEHRPVSNNAE